MHRTHCNLNFVKNRKVLTSQAYNVIGRFESDLAVIDVTFGSDHRKLVENPAYFNVMSRKKNKTK